MSHMGGPETGLDEARIAALSAAAVDARKRRLLSHTALDYLKLLRNPPVKIRFDIVEVLLTDGKVREVRHLPNTFALSAPYRYG